MGRKNMSDFFIKLRKKENKFTNSVRIMKKDKRKLSLKDIITNL